MKMRQLLIGMLPFLLASENTKANAKTNDLHPMMHINPSFGNSDNGCYYATRNSKKRKSNMLHVSKKAKLRHKMLKKAS